MKVSVIIPVFNAEKYLGESVKSALNQPETAEVILVDDGSTDESLSIARKLVEQDNRVVVTRHKDGINMGSAETRNAGIKVARFEYVAFIDADDVFLPGRFKSTGQIFEEHTDADGVYEAVKNVFEDSAISHSETVTFQTVPDIHMVRERVGPEELLSQLIDDPTGIILLQGLCVKRELFERTGLFDPAFRVFEDMLLVKKMAATGRLYPGSLFQPVSERRIHDTNVSFSKYKDVNPTRYMEGETLLLWAITRHLPLEKMNSILRFHYRQFVYRNEMSFENPKTRRAWVWSLLHSFPGAIIYNEFWKAVPLVGRFTG